MAKVDDDIDTHDRWLKVVALIRLGRETDLLEGVGDVVAAAVEHRQLRRPLAGKARDPDALVGRLRADFDEPRCF